MGIPGLQASKKSLQLRRKTGYKRGLVKKCGMNFAGNARDYGEIGVDFCLSVGDISSGEASPPEGDRWNCVINPVSGICQPTRVRSDSIQAAGLW